jgi:hypothetical protein
VSQEGEQGLGDGRVRAALQRKYGPESHVPVGVAEHGKQSLGDSRVRAAGQRKYGFGSHVPVGVAEHGEQGLGAVRVWAVGERADSGGSHVTVGVVEQGMRASVVAEARRRSSARTDVIARHLRGRLAGGRLRLESWLRRNQISPDSHPRWPIMAT